MRKCQCGTWSRTRFCSYSCQEEHWRRTFGAYQGYKRTILSRGETPIPYKLWVRVGCPVTQSMGKILSAR